MKKQFIRLALFVENFILPLLYLWSILQSLSYAATNFSAFMDLSSHWSEILKDKLIVKGWAVYIQNFSFLFFMTMSFIGLIIKKKLIKSPDTLKEVIIPLISTFFYIAYGYLNHFTFINNRILLPNQILPYSTLVGMLINIFGITISAIAVFQLRHSFSIYVEIRDIVSHGLYRYVRHPIYLGYNISTIGLLILQPHVDFMLLAALSTLMLIYRADMEEKKLIANSPVYRAYADKTPAFIPHFS